MFFFIGGIQPKTVTLDDSPRLCPSCGFRRARMRRIDHYLSLFFIPLIRVKTGEPFLYCEQCGTGRPPERPGDRTRGEPSRCSCCGRGLQPDFRYCPSCGAPVT